MIYSAISLWASIFLLPNGCLKALEKMCNSFLWKAVSLGARGAKVSWEIVFSSTKSGGLGLKRLLPWNKVMGLKLIWLLFASFGSLWVSWTRLNLIGAENLWALDASRSGSWSWKSLCQLRQLARPFVVCEVGSSTSASFWHDNWTSLGSLYQLTNGRGPRLSGLPENAVVRDALVNDNWWLHSSRSRNPTISLFKNSLPDHREIVASEAEDCFLWRVGENFPGTDFSTSLMWNHLYDHLPEVSWHKSVWFRGRIPKHAFITWLVALDRLSTRDRMRRWGISVSPLCLLCSSADESRQHLFFDCGYSKEVWAFFFSAFQLSPPPLFMDVLNWLKALTRDSNVNLILKLTFQASFYMIWKERNSRLHFQSSLPAASLFTEIQQLLRAKMDILSKEQRNLPSTVTFLSTWRLVFNIH